MKKYILILLLLVAFGRAKAQSSLNYAAFGVGISVSQNQPYADLKKENSNLSFAITGNYFFTPYVPIGLELQFGKFSGGSATDRTIDVDGRQYENNYKALLLHMDIQAGEVINYQQNTFLNIIKNFYVGSGVGLMFNSATVQETSPYDITNGIPYKFYLAGKGPNFMVPLRFGYEFKIYNGYDQPNIRVDIGYQHNLTFGEGLDGYNDPPTKFKNNALDQYRQITIGLKVNLGGERSYDKEIRGY